MIRTPAVDKLFKETELIYAKARADRVKESQEVFTPFELIERMYGVCDYDFNNHDHTRTWIDPTCGTSNFLVMLAALGVRPENIYGVDLMQDNIDISKERLKEIHLANGVSIEDIEYHQERNLVCANALDYDYSFWETPELEEIW